jgi:hypothetical protein
MKIASTARQLPGRKTKDEEYGRNEAFSNRRSSYTFDLPLAKGNRSQRKTVKNSDAPAWEIFWTGTSPGAVGPFFRG